MSNPSSEFEFSDNEEEIEFTFEDQLEGEDGEEDEEEDEEMEGLEDEEEDDEDDSEDELDNEAAMNLMGQMSALFGLRRRFRELFLIDSESV